MVGQKVFYARIVHVLPAGSVVHVLEPLVLPAGSGVRVLEPLVQCEEGVDWLHPLDGCQCGRAASGYPPCGGPVGSSLGLRWQEEVHHHMVVFQEIWQTVAEIRDLEQTL